MVNSINNILKYFKAEYERSSLSPFGIVTIFCFVLIAKNILVQWQISYLNFSITLVYTEYLNKVLYALLDKVPLYLSVAIYCKKQKQKVVK